MLDGMEQFIALQHGLFEVTPLIFACALLLREAHDKMLPEAQARGLQLSMRLPDNSLRAQGDYQRTLVIMLDLLDNAIRYTAPGGTIHLSADDIGTHVLFSVADSGIGMTPDDMEMVGQPFWRAQHQPLVRRQAGAGLRLALAREVLALQNGELIFSGEIGAGSTFSFTLPAAPPGTNMLS
jgi:signal transduction histidine kinase